MAEQTYAQRVAAAGAITSFDGTAYIRVGEQLVTVANFITTLQTLGNLISGNEITAPDDTTGALLVTAYDDTPTVHPLRVELEGGDYLGGIGTSYDSTAIGFAHGRNVLPVPVFVTANATEPAGIVAGDFWLRPA